jgi:hypothetical protein
MVAADVAIRPQLLLKNTLVGYPWWKPCEKNKLSIIYHISHNNHRVNWYHYHTVYDNKHVWSTCSTCRLWMRMATVWLSLSVALPQGMGRGKSYWWLIVYAIYLPSSKSHGILNIIRIYIYMYIYIWYVYIHICVYNYIYIWIQTHTIDECVNVYIRIIQQ